MTRRPPRQVSWRTLVRAAEPGYDLLELHYEFTNRNFYKRTPVPGVSQAPPPAPGPGPGPTPPPVGQPEIIYTGIRVVDVDIPQAGVVSSAVLELTSAGDFPEDGARLIIRGELTGDAQDFSPGNPLVTDRPWTQAFSNWEPVPWMSGGQKYQTSDISKILEEITDQEAWAPGQAMAFFIYGTGYREFVSDMDGDSSQWPRLIADWAGPSLTHNGDTVTYNGDIVIGI